jgi:hypothetical protein
MVCNPWVGGILKKKKLKINVQIAKQIRDIVTTGTLCSRDVVIKGRSDQGM